MQSPRRVPRSRGPEIRPLPQRQRPGVARQGRSPAQLANRHSAAVSLGFRRMVTFAPLARHAHALAQHMNSNFLRDMAAAMAWRISALVIRWSVTGTLANSGRRRTTAGAPAIIIASRPAKVRLSASLETSIAVAMATPTAHASARITATTTRTGRCGVTMAWIAARCASFNRWCSARPKTQAFGARNTQPSATCLNIGEGICLPFWSTRSIRCSARPVGPFWLCEGTYNELASLGAWFRA